MDAVVKGLIGGSVVSLLIVVAGSVAIFSNFWQNVTPYMMYIWVLLLTALTVGQLVLSSFVVSTLSEAPSQTAQATVQ